MSDEDAGKNGISRGHLTLLRGGLARPISPLEQLERDLRGWAVRGKVPGDRRGVDRYATRALRDIADNIRHPGRIIARIVGDGLDEGASTEWAEEIAPILLRYIRERAKIAKAPTVYLSGEFKRPA